MVEAIVVFNRTGMIDMTTYVSRRLQYYNAFFITTLFVSVMCEVDILLACGKHWHGRIILDT